jgi:N-formylmaleamate deformylase
MDTTAAGRSLTVRANGLTHHLLTYGQGEKGAVFILPGITSPAATADFLARPISELGYRVVVPDLRGRGRSEVPPSGCYRLTDYAADVAGLVAELGLDAPTIVGHSLGARIAAAHAVLHGPARHGMLVLVDPPVSGPGREPYPTSRESFLAQLHEAKRGTTIEAVRRFYPKWPDRELKLRAEVLSSCDETAVLETYVGFHEEDFFDYWRRITPPAALIVGAESRVVTAAAAAELAAANPSIPIHSVPAAGHMIPWDNYPGFMAVLLPLLGAGDR